MYKLCYVTLSHSRWACRISRVPILSMLVGIPRPTCHRKCCFHILRCSQHMGQAEVSVDVLAAKSSGREGLIATVQVATCSEAWSSPGGCSCLLKLLGLFMITSFVQSWSEMLHIFKFDNPPPPSIGVAKYSLQISWCYSWSPDNRDKFPWRQWLLRKKNKTQCELDGLHQESHGLKFARLLMIGYFGSDRYR